MKTQITKINIFKPHKASTGKWNTVTAVRISFIFLGLLCLADTKPVQAQGIGINITGQTPDASAVLDLNTGNGGKYGFLPPKVALTATNVAAPVTAPATGLIVFNTATAGTAPTNVTMGLYYWNGSSWSRLNDANPSIPYGYNVYSYVGPSSSDATAATTTFALMTGMTKTFTPVHSTVYLTCSAACATSDATGTGTTGQLEVVVNGTTVVGGATSMVGSISCAGTYSQAGMFCISLPIAVPGGAGTSITIAIYWRLVGANSLENYTLSDTQLQSRCMIITD